MKLSTLSSKCADVEVKITGPDESSGTQSFFKENVLTAEGETFRASYLTTDSPDFNVVVKTVLTSGDYIGYCPLSYYTKNSKTLTAAKIKNKSGKFIAPSATTISDGSYNPFARQVYMNVLSTSMAKVKDYIKYGLSAAGLALVTNRGLVPLPAGVIATMMKRLV
jgi:phosphate transport system substrate-binding protein